MPHYSLNRSDEWTADGYTVDYPVYRGAQYDASVTNLTYDILSPSGGEPLEIILSFLSPITPTSTLRQSIPASYLSVYVQGSFDVDVYVDVNGQWVSGKDNSELTWDFKQDDAEGKAGLKRWSVRRTDEKLFEETDDRSEWGTLHFTGPGDVRFECGNARRLRQRFSRTGTLQNDIDDNFRSIMDEEPVFAFAKSFKLGNAATTTQNQDSVTFTIAYVQDVVVQYASARGLTHMKPLWQSFFSTVGELLTYHYLDFNNAAKLAQEYSDRLRSDAEAYGGSDYADVLALSARQVMGATSFSGTPDDPILFLKEISSNGNCQTVDIIFPAMPFFLYTSPRWLVYLLEPLLEHQLSGQYPNKYSMHDLGTHFPNMTGHADGRDEYMPVEECGDMLIMALALVQSLQHDGSHNSGLAWSSSDDGDEAGSDSNTVSESASIFPLRSSPSKEGVQHIDGPWGGGARGNKQAKSWLERTYRILKQWTSYLIEFSLEPHNQLSTDDFAGWLALHSNLALKGIIGIKAMSELSNILGYGGDEKYYRNISDVYVSKWQDFAISRDGSHAKLAYNWYGSWTTLYSLYADALLCFHPTITGTETVTTSGNEDEDLFNSDVDTQKPLAASRSSHDQAASDSSDFIPHSIYTNQSAFYELALQRYGLPLDSRHLYAKSDWLFEAAAVVSPEIRREIMKRHASWVNNTVIDRPLSDLYETEDEDGSWGGGVRFFARAVVGGHWAGLVLERACG